MTEVASHAPPIEDVDDFLAWLSGQNGRYEFVDGRIVAAAGGSEPHNDIQVNLLAALKRTLRGSGCKPNGPDLMVRTSASGRRGRFPDASITCGRENGRFVTRPLVVFEVLSPESELRDRTDKRREYQALPSLAHYVLIAQDTMRVELYSRDRAGWRFYEIEGAQGRLELDPPGIGLSLEELYDGLEVLVATQPATEATAG